MILRVHLPLLLLAVLGASSAAQLASTEDVVHIVRPGTVASDPVTSDNMWQRIRDGASRYREYAPVPRVGFYDITYPATAEEYRAVDGYGLLLVTVVTQDATEVPLARVFLSGGQGTHTFRLVSSVRSPVEDPAVSSVLGNTRFDALYLFPMHLRQRFAQLLVDFAANRSGFVLGEFPLQPLDDGLPTERPSGPQPPPDALGQLIRRELPAFVEISAGDDGSGDG